MDSRRVLTALGAGVTTFLLVAVLVIELLDFEFSAIVGLPVALLAGIAAAVVLSITPLDQQPVLRRLLAAYATFGPTIFALLGLRYLNIGRTILSVELVVIVALGASAVVFAVLWGKATCNSERVPPFP
jgi:hypothetical protein